jgi:hypothetical protein
VIKHPNIAHSQKPVALVSSTTMFWPVLTFSESIFSLEIIGSDVSAFQSIAVPPRLNILVLFMATVVIPRNVGLCTRSVSINVSLNLLRIWSNTCDSRVVLPPRVKKLLVAEIVDILAI